MLRRLYHLARADFYERTRRYSFLIMLGLVLWLGYLVGNGTITLRLGNYRGLFNSAWVGSMMALVANTFLGWFGFYLIKNTIERDRHTGVGQIIATTPLPRALYLLGKWLSNLAVFSVFIGLLALAALGLQFFQREDPALDVWALFAPFLFVTLPMLALVAACAVVFETVSWLRGSLGNVVYFFGWSAFMIFSIEVIGQNFPAFDALGIGFMRATMSDSVRAVCAECADSFSLGALITDKPIYTFFWPGVAWTPALIAARLSLVALAAGWVALSAVWFDRFATSDKSAARAEPASKEAEASTAPITHHAALTPVALRFSFWQVLRAELRLSLKGHRWWWYAVAAIFLIAPIVADPEALPVVAGMAYLWPLAVWSALGAREAQHQTHPLTLSAAQPLARQLTATWLGGVLVTALMGLGVGLNLYFSGESLLTWGAGVLAIPTLALACGVWSGSRKVFEVLYIVAWYVGPLNNVAELNYINGPVSTGVTLLIATVILGGVAVAGRVKQLRGN